MKVKILSDRVVGYRVGRVVDTSKLEGVLVSQWLKCGLAAEVVPPSADDTAPSTDEEGAD